MFSIFHVFRRTILLKATTARLDRPDDRQFPYKLEINLSPPEFMQMAFILQFGGSEEIAVGGKTLKDVERFARKNSFETHPRLRRMTISGPDGVIRQWPS